MAVETRTGTDQRPKSRIPRVVRRVLDDAHRRWEEPGELLSPLNTYFITRQNFTMEEYRL